MSQEPVQSYFISVDYLNRLTDYLARKPYYETSKLIDELKVIIAEQNAKRQESVVDLKTVEVVGS